MEILAISIGYGIIEATAVWYSKTRYGKSWTSGTKIILGRFSLYHALLFYYFASMCYITDISYISIPLMVLIEDITFHIWIWLIYKNYYKPTAWIFSIAGGVGVGKLIIPVAYLILVVLHFILMEVVLWF